MPREKVCKGEIVVLRTASQLSMDGNGDTVDSEKMAGCVGPIAWRVLWGQRLVSTFILE